MSIVAVIPTQQQAAAQRSREIRQARSRLKRQIRQAHVSAAAVILAVPDEAASWPIGDLLATQRNWGYDRVRRFLAPFRMQETKPLAMLTERQRQAIAAQLTHPGPELLRCRECGCVDAAACTRPGVLSDGLVCCHWAVQDGAHSLCSACQEESWATLAGVDPTRVHWTHPAREYTDAIAALTGQR